MAYPTPRSMNSDLIEGATDGKYKKVVNARGGEVELATQAAREGLHDTWYGIHEAEGKTLQDTRQVRTAYFEATPKAELN